MTELSRRTALGLIPAGMGLAACGGGSSFETGAPIVAVGDDPREIVRSLVNSPRGRRAAAAGFVLSRGGGYHFWPIASETYGAASGLNPDEDKIFPDLDTLFKTETPFRAASISKLATALLASILHYEGQLDFDLSIGNYLPSDIYGGLQNPPTLRQLLSHTAGITDPDVYWIAHPLSIAPLMIEVLSARRLTSDQFEYSNFGYGIAATVMEYATGTRFDRLYTKTLSGFRDTGFNWSGVDTNARRKGATLYRETRKGWQIQTDGPDVLSSTEPSSLVDGDADLSTYEPGQNGTLFSPQGGLRASLNGLSSIASALGRVKDIDGFDLTYPVWTLNAYASNGIHDQRYFTQFGTGVHIHPADESPWQGQTMWGHHGEAYGLYAGAWYLPDLDISLSYAVTGTPETPPTRSKVHPALNTFTEPLLRAAQLAYAQQS